MVLGIPTREAKLCPWLVKFAQTIAKAPARYRMSEDESAQLTEPVKAYAEANAVAKNPDTNTLNAVMLKDVARDAAKKALSAGAKAIKPQPWISVEDKVAIGFMVNNNNGNDVQIVSNK